MLQRACVRVAYGVATLLVLTACSSGDEAGPTPTPTPSPTVSVPLPNLPVLEAPTPPPGEQVGVELLEGGCGARVTGFAAVPEGLTWVVRDREGFEVLRRPVDLGDPELVYEGSGALSVVLVADRDGRRAAVSRRLVLRC